MAHEQADTRYCDVMHQMLRQSLEDGPPFRVAVPFVNRYLSESGTSKTCKYVGP